MHRRDSMSAIRMLWLVLMAGVAQSAMSGSACAADQPEWKPCPSSAAKVILLHTGAVTLNGQEIAAASLISAIVALRPMPRVVCYTQETPTDQPDPGTSQGVEGLMFVGFGLSVYTDATFTKVLFSTPPRDFRQKRAAGGSEPAPAP
jgi:hypothetical protein